MSRIIGLVVTGALGTLARFYFQSSLHRRFPDFPWGTVTVNLLGCFLFGLIWPLAEERALFTPETRLLILVGFMGAFTTFSTYAFETAQLLQSGRWGALLANVAVQNIAGVALLLGGMVLGRRF